VEHRSVSRTEAPTVRLPEAQPTVHLRDPGAARERPLVLGRYRLLGKLGTGAFGIVWRARDERLQRDVAVKAITHDRAEPGRVEREARLTAQLHDDAIVRLYEVESDGETTYLISELVEGPTLAELLAQGALSDRDVAEIGIALCRALAHAHAKGIVHRDVKPSNVLVPETGHPGAPAAKLTDFGVARVLAGEDVLTRTGDVVGTLAYMAPEQAEGHEAGAPADLYAAALVLYEAFTGANPIRGGSAAATARRLGATLPALCRQRRDLPSALGAAIDRALRPRQGERGTVADLHRALKASLPLVEDEPGTVAAPRVSRAATAVTRRGDRGRQRPPAPLLAGHLLPGLAAGGLMTLALATVGDGGSATTAPNPLVAGALAGVLVALLPRLGWVAAAAVLVGWVAGEVGEPGTALVLACGLAAVPPLLALRGRAWSLPLAAPLLGAIMLAGAYPAIAGQAGTLWRRAALGALGFWLLTLAEPLAHATLFYGAARGTAATGSWEDSLHDTAAHVLAPSLSSGALACAGLWAVGAAVLPWLVRGRRASLDLVAATVWAAGLAAGAGAIGHALGGAVAHPDPRGAALGAAAAVLLAVAARVVRPAHPRPRAAAVEPLP